MIIHDDEIRFKRAMKFFHQALREVRDNKPVFDGWLQHIHYTIYHSDLTPSDKFIHLSFERDDLTDPIRVGTYFPTPFETDDWKEDEYYSLTKSLLIRFIRTTATQDERDVLNQIQQDMKTEF